MKAMLTALSLGWVAFSTVAAEVTTVATTPILDGRLDEPVWKSAKWEGGFHRVGKLDIDRRGPRPAAPTEFAILADTRNLYVGVRCHEPLIDRIPPDRPLGDFWSSDFVEVYLSPSGTIFDFYQFAVTLLGDGRYAQYYAESGNITPDPYAPQWFASVARGKDFWSCEFEIPLNALYMTRNAAWNTTWLVNVSRSNTLEHELSSWAEVRSAFREIKKFPRVSGFPQRRAEDDIAVTGAAADIADSRQGVLTGTLTLETFAAVAGDYTLEVSVSDGSRDVTLKQGVNKLKVPCSFNGNGRHSVGIALRHKASGSVYRREYPVETDFEFFKVRLTSPEYRDNFYPGQDATKIVGTVKSAKSGEVKVALEGAGIPKVEQILPEGGGAFAFETPGFADGTAQLVFAADGESRTVEVRKLPPSGHRMTWISGGNVVVDGRPILRRNMYALYYLGGKKFREKYDADDLRETREFSWGGGLEAWRLIPGGERREAVKDAPPSAEMLAKIDEVIEKWRDKDFGYYYIEDEPECRGVSPVYLRHVYDYVSKKDPYHVIAMATRGGTRFINCADLFETHPYLNPYYDDKGVRRYGRQPNELGDYVEVFSSLNRGDKCIGFLPTAFSYPGGAFIDFREYVLHTWAAMIRGGKTLFPYAWHEFGARASTYEGTRYIFSTFERLSDFILFGDRRELVRTPNYEAVVYRRSGDDLFVCVNLSTAPQRVAVKGLDGSFVEFRGDRTFDLSSPLSLNPLETIVATRKPCSEGLKTYAEVDADIEASERERLGRDNQLLGKERQIEVSSSHTVSTCWSLVDGNRDLLGWLENKPNGFYEMAFPKFTPEFSRIAVHGYNLDGMKVKVRRLGAWEELKPVNEKKVKYGLAYAFAEKIRPVKLRLEFTKRFVELYEIELPGRSIPSAAAESGKGPIATPGAKWRLDGRNADTVADTSEKGWKIDDGEGVSGESDGSLRCRSRMNHAVRLGPDARWFTFDVRSAKRRERGKYTGLTIQLNDLGRVFSSVNGVACGIYTIKLPPSKPDEWCNLQVYNYNLDFTVGSFALVAEPENYVEVTPPSGGKVAPGETLHIKVVLKDPCADLNCAFYRDCGRGSERFNINGSGSVELRATDGVGRMWEAELSVGSCGSARKREVSLRVTTLGGALDVPLITTIDAEFTSKGEK